MNSRLSLNDLLGSAYMEAVCRAARRLLCMDEAQARALANEKVEFFPDDMQKRLDALLDEVGDQILPALPGALSGAPSDAYRAADHWGAAPVGGIGPFRLGQDGRLYLAAKSEHYHIPLGHNFPGYRLLDYARRLGVTNAAHNNTRGYVTRLCERELIRTANGLKKEDEGGLEQVLGDHSPHVLNRVINLETGSLACEAAIKMMLARFYRMGSKQPAPSFAGKKPVFLVMGDNEGGVGGNYHGTTLTAQTLRGMWPQFRQEAECLYLARPVRINDLSDFEEKLRLYSQGEYRVAGFLHEIILMNYGGVRLEPAYLRAVYDLCHRADVPVLCDEIQSCMWYEGMYLFRQYGLNPDFVSVGKGFPGGQYPASRILFTAPMDNMEQFGALVTNGQEELASLAYLITMAFAEENGGEIRQIGEYCQNALEALCVRHPDKLARVEGQGLLIALHFQDVGRAMAFAKAMNDACVDVSVQAYKASCPPAALLKLPVISSTKLVDALALRMERALEELT